MLNKMFQKSDPVDDEENTRFVPLQKIENAVFVYHNPETFSYVLGYLCKCNGNLTQFDMPRESLSDADFFQLT